MSSKSALIIGATGAVGQCVLKELLASSHYSKVGEYGRRVTDMATLSVGKDKLVQKTINFEKMGESGLKDGKWDVVFITLGTNKKTAGSAEAFEKIDREYVVNSAKEARVEGATQRVVYCSSVGASPDSSYLYPRSKGLTELELAGLGYSDTIIYRPAVLAAANRSEKRFAETFATSITSVLSHFSSALEIKVPVLGKSLVMAGFYGTDKLPDVAHAKRAGVAPRMFTLVDNAGANALATTPWE